MMEETISAFPTTRDEYRGLGKPLDISPELQQAAEDAGYGACLVIDSDGSLRFRAGGMLGGHTWWTLAEPTEDGMRLLFAPEALASWTSAPVAVAVGKLLVSFRKEPV